MMKNPVKFQMDLVTLLLRLGLAAIFIIHGYFKIMQNVPLTPELSTEAHFAVGWGELICGLALVFGLASRLAALGIAVLQIGAIILVTGQDALAGPQLDVTGKWFDLRRVGP